MNNEIKSLTEPKPKSPPILSMFEDATGGYSYTRVVGFLFIIVFLGLITYASIQTGTIVIPPKEWVYLLVSFAAIKPLQRFAEAKELESQNNYEFQMSQLNKKQDTKPS